MVQNDDISIYYMKKYTQMIGQMFVVLGIFMWPAMSFAQTIVNMRYADHPNFSRIVFDWQEDVTYQANITGNKLEIIFDKESTPSWPGILDDPLSYMTEPSYRFSDGQLIVTFTVPDRVQLKDFRYDTKTVFDIYKSNSSVDDAPSPQINAVERKPVDQVELQPIKKDKSNISSVKDLTQPKASSDEVVVGVSRARDNIKLTFPWGYDVRSAAFIRHSNLWVVFEGKKRIDQSELDSFLGQRILSARQIEHPTMTILVYDILEDQYLQVQNDKNIWKIILKNVQTAPDTPILSGHQRTSGNKGENFFFAVDDAGQPIVIVDPTIGDEIAIVPVSKVSQGVLQNSKFAEFESLATAQGIAIRLIADNLEILKYRNGVSVATEGGLAISQSQLSSTLGLAIDTGSNNDKNHQLVNLSQWKKGPLEHGDYHANKHELLYRLSNSTGTNRNEGRWQLAKFYLANGRRMEAFGVLNVMLDENSKLIESPEFRATLAVTNVLMRRYKEAIQLLEHKSFLAEQGIKLWKTIAYSALGNYELALENYKEGSDALSYYSANEKVNFLFAAIKSAYETGDKDFVELGISMLKKMPLNARQLTAADYWKAMLERDAGNTLMVEELLQTIAKSNVRETAAWAAFDLINMQYDNEEITATEAIDKLEKLRFSWRGDDFELDLLSRLGDIYVAQHEYNTGLHTLKLAVTFFEGSEKTAKLTQQMSAIYSDLFLHGGADVMTPVKAVALYSEFRELIPLGTDGDNMTRRLADRLVSLDLLDEAAELLEHQIKFRLKGGAQSSVASRLAIIYLLNSKPDMALGILRATRDSQIPRDVEDRRNMIEGRALIELGRYEEAEVLIERYKTQEAEDMRSDIYWKSENWAKYIDHEDRMLGNRFLDETDLSNAERLSVLRMAVAYVINGDKQGVKTIRDKYKSHMNNGLYSDIFEVITAERQLTDLNVRRLTKSIASVAKLENFMESYRSEFSTNSP